MSSTISFTYNQLIAELQDWAEDSGTEFVAAMQTIVSMGETKLLTDLNMEIFDQVTTGSLTASQRNQAIKGADWQATRTIHLTNAGDLIYLDRRTYEWCLDYGPDVTVEAQPLYYAELNETEFYLVPTPDTTYAYTLRSVAKPSALTVANQNTWLGDQMGDILLYACLLVGDRYLKSQEEFLIKWGNSYLELLGARKLELRNSMRADYSPIADAARTIGDST